MAIQKTIRTKIGSVEGQLARRVHSLKTDERIMDPGYSCTLQ